MSSSQPALPIFLISQKGLLSPGPDPLNPPYPSGDLRPPPSVQAEFPPNRHTSDDLESLEDELLSLT